MSLKSILTAPQDSASTGTTPPSTSAEHEQFLFDFHREPDKSFYLQADGKFVQVNECDDSGIPWSISSPKAQANWPRK